MSYEVGSRVGVILSMDSREVRFCGYGVYEGDRLVPEWRDAIGLYATMLRDPEQLSEQKLREDSASLCQLVLALEHDGREPTAAELEESYRKLRATREQQAGLDDEGIAQHLLGQKSNSLIYNPLIRTDNGAYWWGRECWWGPEEKVREKIAAAVSSGARLVELSDRVEAGLKDCPPAD